MIRGKSLSGLVMNYTVYTVSGFLTFNAVLFALRCCVRCVDYETSNGKNAECSPIGDSGYGLLKSRVQYFH
jgi:hypothetical protein